ncbi:MAG: teicoplanin resistance protein VanZ [Clostridia bacterium]
MPDEERREKMEDWKNTKDFPMQGQMLNQLYQYGIVISDMKEKMESFFDEIKNVSKKINKCIHKQGLRFFYVSRNHPINIKKDDKVFIENYVDFLEKTIGIIAVMRLAIDPYPVLLMDEEILLRCFDSMTEAYKNEFVEKYITNETLKEYKKTEMYINHYNGHITEEKKNYAVFDIMKHQVIDTTKRKEILSQIHLLDNTDKIATYIALISKKVVKIYTYGGLQMYFTDRKTNRKALSWDGMEFKQFEESNEKFNQNYDEVFISVFTYNIGDNKQESFFVEHNECLNDYDINLIKELSVDKIMEDQG